MQHSMHSGHLRRWGAMIGCSALLSGLALSATAGAAQAVETSDGAEPSTTATPVVGTTWGDAKADKAALSLGSRVDSLDPGSLFTLTYAVGARQAWTQKDARGRALTGQGVTVAVLDSGVQAVPGLDQPGQIVRGPDLSLEVNSDQALPYDTFGHGTHMAGIIAASDPVAVDPKTGAPKSTDPSVQLGVAPDAQLLALKLATTDGSTDVSQVIAALDWVAAHRTDNGMNVRVVNLSFGTEAIQPYQIDPLAAAAEHAWRKGLVVVVSGGNDGEDAGSLSNPAIDPFVIAVGASDPNGTTSGWASPSVADFSSRGTDARHVDLVAPGRSVASFRAPGSFVDVEHPEGLVAGDTAGRLFRGSGTSQAAAVVSGAAALVLQANPSLTPDQVKDVLVRTARPLTGEPVVDAGAGQLNVAAAVELAKKVVVDAKHPAAKQTWAPATGLGSLDAARGGSHLVDPESGDVLAGEVDVLGTPWDPAAWAQASTAGTSWDGGLWMRARWSGDAWTADGWARARWSDTAWSRARWSDASWDRARWSRARWSDASWERARWSSVPWT